jgi:hypothetical protein
MKIKDLVEAIKISLTNEEREFVEFYGREITLSNLEPRENWIAQNLVRKGIYEISNDERRLLQVKNAYTRPSLQQI